MTTIEIHQAQNATEPASTSKYFPALLQTLLEGL